MGAVDVGSVVDDHDCHEVSDPVDDAEVSSSCAVQAIEFATQRLPDSVRVLGEAAVDEHYTT